MSFLALKNSSTFCFVRFFSVRFFVVEDHMLHATQGLVTRPFMDELWNMALSKIIAVLRTHSVRCTLRHTQTLTYCLSSPFSCDTCSWHFRIKVACATRNNNHIGLLCIQSMAPTFEPFHTLTQPTWYFSHIKMYYIMTTHLHHYICKAA